MIDFLVNMIIIMKVNAKSFMLFVTYIEEQGARLRWHLSVITWPYSKFWLDNNRTDPLRCQNHNKPVVSAMMSNPRKFSEKIALHNQKQAEETAAFEAILRDVSFATKVRRTWPISDRNVG